MGKPGFCSAPRDSIVEHHHPRDLLLLLLAAVVNACATRSLDPAPGRGLAVIADSIYSIDEVTVRPRMLNRSDVNREVSARFERLPPESRVGGTIRHELLIDTLGAVRDIRLVQSSGRPDLDQAVAAGLALAQFSPGSTEGRLVQVWTEHSMKIEVHIIPM